MSSKKGTKILTFALVKNGHADDYGTYDIVFVSTEDQHIAAILDPDDGYRSYCKEIDEYDEIFFFVKMSAPQESDNRTEILYDKIEYRIKEDLPWGEKPFETRGYERTEWIVRAWREGKIVFELGTSNYDDYYPSSFISAEKGISEDYEEP